MTEKLAPERRLLGAALLIAAEAPETPTPTARRAYVRWELIEEMRRALEAMGVDWRHLRPGGPQQTGSSGLAAR